MAAHGHTPLMQLLHHAWRAIDLATSTMSLVDQLCQFHVASAARTGGPSPPGIKTRTRDVHKLADHRERERFAVCFDEGEDLAFSSEANRMAFFRISCSI